ncbi:MAG: hypothetical protein WBB17_08830 [Saprospiraceae bacterium]|nr:hypothetical protein [Saprospiraceae bacterium]MBK9994259.1 hypothetical protein [Saprospiraceae bacterium]
MWKSVFILIISLFLVMDSNTLCAQYSAAHNSGFKLIETKTFRYDNDHDIFEFKTPTKLNAFYVVVKDANVGFNNVVIHYVDGTKNTIELNKNLFPDVYSMIMSPNTPGKAIKKIYFYHSVKVTKRQRPRVELWVK